MTYNFGTERRDPLERSLIRRSFRVRKRATIDMQACVGLRPIADPDNMATAAGRQCDLGTRELLRWRPRDEDCGRKPPLNHLRYVNGYRAALNPIRIPAARTGSSQRLCQADGVNIAEGN